MPQSISYVVQLFCMRIIEVLIALAYIILMAYSGTHPGWWINLQIPLSLLPSQLNVALDC